VNFMPRPKKQAAAGGAETGQVNKAELIRQTARSMPKPVRPRDIIAALKEKGVTVTSPQVSKTLKQAGFKRKGRRRKAAVNGAGDVSKAERIRQLAKAMGKSVRPRDIVATMADEGVKVASAQVSTVLAAAGYRRKGRKGRRGRRRGATAVGTNSIARSAGQSLDIEALVAAKALVAKVGGLERAEAAISVLKKLQ
jgi:arginine repressor